MTIYQSLLNFGFSDEEINPDDTYSDTRTVSLFRSDTPDGYPIVGLRYVCDFKCEEEMGVGTLAKAFSSAKKQRDLIYCERDSSVVSFNTRVDTRYMDHALKKGGDYTKESGPYLRYGIHRFKLEWMTVPELRDHARKNNISLTGLRKKEHIVDKIISNSPLRKPNTYPGWFQNGQNLVLPKMSGVIGKTFDYLVYAARYSNSLAVGSGKEVFASGLVIYDKRDIGPKLQEQIDEDQRFYDESMVKLKPVEKELKNRGHGWYFLGNPSMINTTKDKSNPPELKYWLNAQRRDNEYGGQPSGWYSIDELLSEKWVTDQKSKKG